MTNPAVQEGRRPLVILSKLAAVAFVASTAGAGLPSGEPARGWTVVLTAVTVALWLVGVSRRVRDPWVIGGALLLAGLAGAALDLLRPVGPGFLVAYMALTVLGLRLERRFALAVGGVVVLAALVTQAHTSTHPLSAALNLGLGAAFLFAASAFAAVSRDAREQAEARRAQELATRAAREEAAVLAERTRLARELHDVLAHTLSGLAVQLEGARLLAERTGADERLVEEVTRAQRLARDGMSGARRAVSALRGEDLPGPEQLAELVEQMRLSAGIPVSLAVQGKPHPVSPESGLALYRTVQEALTNTAKHAGKGATAQVTLTYADDHTGVEVVDHAGSGTPSGMPSGGFGLTGLAERAALAGGALETGRTEDGWRVALRMPTSGTPAVPGPAEGSRP